MIDRIRTRYGPLVRGWGDATLATKNDVTVRVNGIQVEVSRVNPFTGEIFLAIPLAPAAPGTRTVEVDYIWLTNPVLPLAGLNQIGANLNTWDRAIGRATSSSNPVPSTSIGAAKTHRFPMGVVLGPHLSKESPVRVGHKYIGFQRSYSAMLNSASTLRLNNSPVRSSVGGMSADTLKESGLFDGVSAPADGSPSVWSLLGVDSGGVVGDGTYRLVDASAGPYGIGTSTIYFRNLDLSLTTSVASAVRVQVESYTPDGVFSGVGFGVHDGQNLLLVGLLEVNETLHVGVLLDGENPHREESWSIGPSMTVLATGQSTLRALYEDLPRGVVSGTRFRIASGNQAGVYTVSSCGVQISEDGTYVFISTTSPLPADVALFENSSFDVLFEVLWDTAPITLRSSALYPTGSATVTLGGALSGVVAEIATLPAFPAQTALMLPATELGVAFWGSISTRATNSSIWDFTQYVSNPQRLTETSQGISVVEDMSSTPEEDLVNPWYIVGGFGFARSEAGVLLLKSTSGSIDGSIDQEFSYERVEPFLTQKVSTNVEAEFRVDSGILGAGDAEIRVRDTVRSASLRTLLYVETASARALVTDLPQESLSGLQDPVAAGWAKAGGNTLSDPFVRNQTLQFTKTSTQTGWWTSPALVPPNSVDYSGVIIEGTVSFQSSTQGSLGNGFTFGGMVPISPTLARGVWVSFVPNGVSLLDTSLSLVFNLPLVWDDTLTHTFRVLCDPDANLVILHLDDTLVGSVALANFFSTTSTPFLFVGGIGDGACEATLDSLSMTPLRPVALPATSLGRTFGILLRDRDPDHIDSYRIPRDDGTLSPNSSLSCTPVEMDWRSDCEVRFYLDPTWGASFYRLDLAAPPWFTENFATDTTDPTAAWATVEYRQLPVHKSLRGSVSFGSLDPRSISQQRWNNIQYRIRGSKRGFGIAPQGMVLNRMSPLTSGEMSKDMTLEVVTVNSRTSTTVYVPDSAMHADRVFMVQVGDTVLLSSAWLFDKASQTLTLTAALSSQQSPVTLTFAPAKPVTKAYLEAQSISDTVTVLNQGTPPVPWSRTLPSTRTVEVDGNHEAVVWADGPEALYSNLKKISVTDGNEVHISALCDGPGPGEGLSHIGIEGQFTSDMGQVTGGPGGPLGAQSPFLAGSARAFNSSKVLTLSGGARLGGLIGMTGASLHPSARGPSRLPILNGMGMNQEFRLVLESVTPYADSYSASLLLGDNVPPEEALPISDVVPDGTPGLEGHGACAYTLEDQSSSVSRIGPWGGLSSLTPHSLLAGGAQLSGSQFVLIGGAPIARPVVSSGNIEAAN